MVTKGYLYFSIFLYVAYNSLEETLWNELTATPAPEKIWKAVVPQLEVCITSENYNSYKNA
jgi:hypothetical protein